MFRSRARSEIIEAVLTAYFKSDVDHVARVREPIIRAGVECGQPSIRICSDPVEDRRRTGADQWCVHRAPTESLSHVQGSDQRQSITIDPLAAPDRSGGERFRSQ